MFKKLTSVLPKLLIFRQFTTKNLKQTGLIKMTNRPTVGILIIGDEILKGRVQDANSYFLCQNFYEIGIEVSQISVLPDNVDLIAKQVSDFSNTYTYVVTTGGVGPTHDDVTYEAIAKAMKEPLVEKPALSSLLEDWCNLFGIKREAASKMGLVPQSSNVHFIRNFSCAIESFPIVSVGNIYIFPGIPSDLQRAFAGLKHIFASNLAAKCFYQRNLCLGVDEFYIIEHLNELVDNFKDRVSFGSYPATSMHYATLITMEGENKDTVLEAEALFREMLPTNCIVSSTNPTTPESIMKVLDLANGKLKTDPALGTLPPRLVKNSVEIIEESFQKYAPESVCLCFNGGKDCTALLHLAHSVFKMRFGDDAKFKAVYISSTIQFPELDDFIHQTVERYGFNLITFEGPLQDALTKLKNEHPEIEAVLMGTRRSDPNASDLIPFKLTDNNWPSFMRVSPLLDWEYNHVWSFLRSLEVPYCSLYDKGYTSIGNKNNTKPNDYLRYSLKGVDHYHPAYLLQTSIEERNGRV